YIATGLLLIGLGTRRARKAPKTMSNAIGKLHCSGDPFPALGHYCFSLSATLVFGQLDELCRVLQPALCIVRKQVAGDDAARLRIGVKADEHGTGIVAPYRLFGQHALDLPRMLVPLWLLADRLPDLLLPGMVVRHAERHDLFEGEFV